MPASRLRRATLKTGPLHEVIPRAKGEHRLFLPTEVLHAALLNALCRQGLSLSDADVLLRRHDVEFSDLDVAEDIYVLHFEDGHIFALEPLAVWADIQTRFRQWAARSRVPGSYFALARFNALKRYVMLFDKDEDWDPDADEDEDEEFGAPVGGQLHG
jgi:hypothetical protein